MENNNITVYQGSSNGTIKLSGLTCEDTQELIDRLKHNKYVKDRIQVFAKGSYFEASVDVSYMSLIEYFINKYGI